MGVFLQLPLQFDGLSLEFVFVKCQICPAFMTSVQVYYFVLMKSLC